MLELAFFWAIVTTINDEGSGINTNNMKLGRDPKNYVCGCEAGVDLNEAVNVNACYYYHNHVSSPLGTVRVWHHGLGRQATVPHLASKTALPPQEMKPSRHPRNTAYVGWLSTVLSWLSSGSFAIMFPPHAQIALPSSMSNPIWYLLPSKGIYTNSLSSEGYLLGNPSLGWSIYFLTSEQDRQV